MTDVKRTLRSVREPDQNESEAIWQSLSPEARKTIATRCDEWDIRRLVAYRRAVAAGFFTDEAKS
jgi:hypothetical protein